MIREPIDLHAVSPIHYVIHGRLENWARYIRDSMSRGTGQPMFRHYKPYLVAREPAGYEEPDSLDAMKVEKGVAALPNKHAYAVRWCYVFPWRNEHRVCRVLAVQPAKLHELIGEGRSILKNRLTNAGFVLQNRPNSIRQPA